MIVPDVNLLIYAYDAGSPFHAATAKWWGESLSGTEAVGLAPVVLFGFLRIATHPRVFRFPMTVATAAAHLRSWLEQPCVRALDAGPAHVQDVVALLEAAGTAANLVTDAQIAALAMEHDAVLHTADSDFLRFPGLRWFNPMTGVSSPKRRPVRTGR